ncbi:lyso-ornithine lipid acyltransferase [Streptomyces sp. TLI_235]|nr:lysophospholipid acyltransferase family protein [Streptomyces sp. TLI_235]PBC69625.1 lyso-ornithine lipid acyltransferase [Streptomyces sp. TLI_235]
MHISIGAAVGPQNPQRLGGGSPHPSGLSAGAEGQATAVPHQDQVPAPPGPAVNAGGRASTGGWIPVSSCDPQRCIDTPAPTVGTIRRLARYAGCAVAVMMGFPLLPLVRRCSWLPSRRLARLWSRAIMTALGIRVRVLGSKAAEQNGGLLVVANHVSWLDIPLLGSVRPGRMLAKSELGEVPVLGGIAARNGTIFVQRERLRALPATLSEISRSLRADGHVVGFPEGTTWCGRDTGPFRPALFQAAIDACAPVQPAVITYRCQSGELTTAPAYLSSESLLVSLRKAAAMRGLVAEVRLLPTIPAGSHQNRRSLMNAAQAAVNRALAERG